MVDFERTISDTEKAVYDALAAQQTALIAQADQYPNHVQYAEIAVTSAEVLALNATPKTLVAAPGAGFVLEFISAVFILDWVSAAYANNGILSVRETDDSGAALSVVALLAPFLAQVADTVLPVQPLSTGLALTANTAMVLSMATGESITGDSPLRIKVAYRVHSTGL